MSVTVRKGSFAMERKTIRISEKRQITIPRKYFEALGFGSEAECLLRGNEIVLRPLQPAGGEFAEQILTELVAKGLSGDALLDAFRQEQKKIRPAVEAMLSDAQGVAHGKGKSFSYDDVFGPEG